MPDNLVVLKQDEYERMMKAVRFVEGMQRGPVRGHEQPETPPGIPSTTAFVKVSGPEDTDFRPGDTDTHYYPCVRTEKVIPTAEEETTYGPFSPGDYWRDYDDPNEDPVGRVFAFNGGTLEEGKRYAVDPINARDKAGEDGVYTIFVVNKTGEGTSDPCETITVVTGVTFDEEECDVVVTTAEILYRDCE
jgi:hypothetical protein